MKIPLSWLREFVDVPGTAEEIAARMSVRGFAVEGIEQLPDGEAVIDFEVTANRPDCLSVSGMAREVATAYGLQVRRPAVRGRGISPATDRGTPRDAEAPPGADTGTSTSAAVQTAADSGLQLVSLKTVEQGDVDIVIERTDWCARYAGALADVTVGPSPDWMQARLRAAGVRPISNIVDITNYVLIELGQPMHAFDHATLEGGRIRVRAAAEGERLRTLDGQERTLTTDMLVIADSTRPVAVAGVMGGAETEVTAGTRTILLESAQFDARAVRRASRSLGLRTEASTRFERGADPRLPVTAMERACALLEIAGAGQARGTVVDRYAVRVEPRTVHLRRARLAMVLGTEIPDSGVRHILESLGFALRNAEEGWDVTVPTRRVDVRREADLIEEVARHYGFDRIPATFPALNAAPPPVDPRITQTRQLRAAMTGAGFSEAVTFGFMSAASARPFAADGEPAAIANPLSETFAVLRPSILPGLIDAVAHNRRREQRDVRLFEVGSRFSIARGEERAIACVWTGAAAGVHWSGSGREVDFFDIKGLAERICDALALQAHAVTHQNAWLVAGRAAALEASGQRIGTLGQLVPALADRHGLPPHDAVYVVEIDLDAAARVRDTHEMRIRPLPRFPSVTRDISILVDDSSTAATLRRTIEDAAPALLQEVHEFDRYQGAGIPPQKVSLSFRLVFRSTDRTLTDVEVEQSLDAVVAALAERHGAVRR
jgi:phenylalanyl-tRNA synthetase beta chain